MAASALRCNRACGPLDRAVLAEGVVLEIYAFRGGLIARMDISEPGP
jgi:hypothetical protein